MKIIDPGTQQLPNGLVLHHVNELEAKFASQDRQNTIPSNLKAALRDVRTCLTRPPTSNPGDIVLHKEIKRGNIVRLTQTLTKKFKLLPSECLMIINHRPVTKEELAGLLEELEERMDEEKQEKLLELVSREFGQIRAADAKAGVLDGEVNGDEDGTER